LTVGGSAVFRQAIDLLEPGCAGLVQQRAAVAGRGGDRRGVGSECERTIASASGIPFIAQTTSVRYLAEAWPDIRTAEDGAAGTRLPRGPVALRNRLHHVFPEAVSHPRVAVVHVFLAGVYTSTTLDSAKLGSESAVKPPMA
jgi:hypothetical protein